MNPQNISELAQQLSSQLIKQQQVLACAESCTGGWIAKAITDIDGSSQYFDCSIVTYSNQAKTNLLGVQSATLESHGAVSQAVVKEMVLGLLDRCDASLGISVSGVAGPGGGTADKPVGTVWIAWARPGQLIEAVRFKFNGDREQVRLQAVHEALKGVERLLSEE